MSSHLPCASQCVLEETSSMNKPGCFFLRRAWSMQARLDNVQSSGLTRQQAPRSALCIIMCHGGYPKTNRPFPHLSTNKSFSQHDMKKSSKLSSIGLATRSHPGVPAISFTASLSWLTGCQKPIQIPHQAREEKIPHQVNTEIKHGQTVMVPPHHCP